MKTILLFGAFFSATTASAYPGPQIQGQQINPASSLQVVAGTFSAVNVLGGLTVKSTGTSVASEFDVAKDTFNVYPGTVTVLGRLGCKSGTCSLQAATGASIYPFEVGAIPQGWDGSATWTPLFYVDSSGNANAHNNLKSIYGYLQGNNVRVGDWSASGLSGASGTNSGGKLNLQNAVTDSFEFRGATSTTASPLFLFNALPSGSPDLWWLQKNGVAVTRVDVSGHWSFGDANPACSTCTAAVHGSLGVSGVVEADGGIKFNDGTSFTSANGAIVTTSSPTLTGSWTFGNGGFSTTTFSDYTNFTATTVFTVGGSTFSVFGVAVTTVPAPGDTFSLNIGNTGDATPVQVWSDTMTANSITRAAKSAKTNQIVQIVLDVQMASSGTEEFFVYFGKCRIFNERLAGNNALLNVVCRVKPNSTTSQVGTCSMSSAGALSITAAATPSVSCSEDITTAIPITFNLSSNVAGPAKWIGGDWWITGK